MGRTGRLWAWQGRRRPDVMTVAKGLGGGLPIGACVTTPARRRLQPGDHGPLRRRPGGRRRRNAVLDVVDDEAFLPAVARRGERLAGGLRGSASTCAGAGLMLAFDAASAPALARRPLLEQRLVVNATGPDTIRLLPPLTVAEDEIDEAVRADRRLALVA